MKQLATKATLMACLAAFLMAGCYGPFRLTRKLHSWNGSVGKKWVNEGVFLIMVILPVYGFATLGDAIILNSIEFWTGKNPLASSDLSRGSQHAFLRYDSKAEAMNIVTRDGNAAHFLRIEKTPDGGFQASDGHGILGTSERRPDGNVVVRDASRKILASYGPEQTARILAERISE